MGQKPAALGLKRPEKASHRTKRYDAAATGVPRKPVTPRRKSY